jgi:site-specific DNA recombinase
MNLQNRIAIYARLSSDQQVQQATIESQLAAVQKFATDNGLKIDPHLIFADNGLSGITLARPQLDALRDQAATVEINRILILDPPPSGAPICSSTDAHRGVQKAGR